MSEETNTQENDGTWSGLKKTIIGTLATLVTGGGAWLGVTLFGGHSSESNEGHKTEQAAPASPVINVNVSQNQENKQQQKCPYCGSLHVQYVVTTNKPSNWLLILLSVITFTAPATGKKVYHCYDCGFEFDEIKTNE